MRLPFLQVEIEDARRLGAQLAAIDPKSRHAWWWRGLLEELWSWGLNLSGEDRPTGECNHPRAAEMLCGVLGWVDGPESLLELLTAVEVVARTKSGGLRVRGVVGRYGPAWDRQKQQSINGRKGAKERWKDGDPIGTRTSDPNGTRSAKTETETETETETDLKRSVAKKPATPPDPRLEPLKNALVVDYETVRGEPYKHGGAPDTNGLKSLLPLATDEKIRDRWRSALQRTEYPRVSTFAQLASKWPDLAAPNRPATKGPVDAGTQVHTKTGLVTDTGIVSLEELGWSPP